MSDLEHIKKKLRDYGFYPDFSTKSKYFTKLKSYLGLKQANELLDNIDIIISSSEDPEHDIAHLVGQDSQLLKIIYSTGIVTSACIFNSMLEILDSIDIEPKVISDLGGANGWTLQLLDEYFELNSKLVLIDYNPNWDLVNENIKVINSEYAHVTEKINADLIISIFGIKASESESLLKCAANNLTNNGYLLVSLRIPDDSTFKSFQETAMSLGLGIIIEKSKRVQYFNSSAMFIETFPVLLISNNVKQSEIFRLEDIQID